MRGPSLTDWASKLKGEIGRDDAGIDVIRCPGPGHSAEDRSLSVWLDKDAPQGFRTLSFADDPFDACRDYVAHAVGLPAWEPAHKANGNAKMNGHAKPRRQVIRYVYRDVSGEPVMQVTRYVPKGFSQSRPDGRGGWTAGLDDRARERLVPYRLPELQEAIALGKTVFVVEGEKAVEALEARGLPATCSPMGAGSWRDTYSKWFAGASVIVLPDQDAPGRKHAGMVRENLKPVAEKVRVINLPDLPLGGDVVDWLEAGNDPATIATMAENFHDEAAAGAAILDAIFTFIGKFVAYPDLHAQVAHALWIAHTYLLERLDTTPRLLFLSPEPGSGKTRGMEVTELLALRASLKVNASVSYIFRLISDDAGRPTLLHDEIDAIFGSKAAEHEDLRALINAGYRRGATVGRVVPQGKNFILQDFPAYCAIALAGLGDLPDTIMSRSVVIRMRRRRSDETIEAFRRRDAERAAEPLRTALAEWASKVEGAIGHQWPQMPEGVEDRAADTWEALVVVADAAGGTWPQRAREAAVAHVRRAREAERQSQGVRLLNDLKLVFGEREHMSTIDILDALNRLEDAPWGDLRGKPLDARGLARRLDKFEVKRTTIRLDARTTAKGYRREDLHDAWARYLSHSPEKSVTSVTSDTSGDAQEQAP